MFDINRVQDIQIPDVSLRQQYYNYFFNGGITEAQDIYNSNPQLEGKCLNASMLNSLLDSILSLEGYYDTGVTQYLLNALNQFNISIDELANIGEWSATKQYKVNNFVTYNNEIYFCILTPTIGTLPTDTTFWVGLSLRGEKGSASLGVNYRGSWNSTDTYNELDMVVYQDELYVAITTNTNVNPTNTTYWFKALAISKDGIHCGSIAPTKYDIGAIWFRYYEESNVDWSTYESMYWGDLLGYDWGAIERGV